MKALAGSAAAFAVAVAFMAANALRPPTYDFGNGYTWSVVDGNVTVIKNDRGDIVLGPGWIELWGVYPWIYGYIKTNDNYHRFMINTISSQVHFPEQRANCLECVRKEGLKECKYKKLSLPSSVQIGENGLASLFTTIYTINGRNNELGNRLRKSLLPSDKKL